MDDSQPLSLLSSSGPRVVSYKISTGVTVWESRSSESESESDGTNGVGAPEPWALLAHIGMVPQSSVRDLTEINGI